MSRAFTPPDTFSQDDISTLTNVRRALWINGLFGLGAGSVVGMGGHIILQSLQKKYVSVDGSSSSSSTVVSKGKVASSNANSWIYKCLKPLPPLGRNTFLLSLLGGGALGSFILSTTAGVNNVHVLHPIFNLGRNENAGKSPYQIMTTNAKQQPDDLSDATTTNTVATHNGEDELDAAHHRSRSIRRQESMRRRLESGGSLSDAHSNTWPTITEEEAEDVQKGRAMHRAEFWGKQQTHRRQALQDRIEHGKALSNSTGGHWSNAEK